MECKFSKRFTNSNLEVKIGDDNISQVTQFKYLGSTIQGNERIEGDINHRIPIGWMKRRSSLGVIYDRKIPFNHTTIRLVVLYGTKYWAVKN